MLILIVEDDGYKYLEVEKVVRAAMPNAIINRTENVRDTVVYLSKQTPDKIILDMSLPGHTAKAGEGNPLSMPNGGIEVILELRYLGHASIPIIILTQYPDIEIEFEYFSIEEAAARIKEAYNISNVTVSYYNSAKNWRAETAIFLGER